MQTQSIIVYRNPLEQQLWEGGYIGLYICFAVVFCIILVGLMKLAGKVFGEWKVSTCNTYTWVAVALAVGLTWLVFHFLPLFI
jgi:hypothetical protein